MKSVYAKLRIGLAVLHTAGTIPFWCVSKDKSTPATKEAINVVIAFFSFTIIGLLLAVVILMTSHLKKLKPPQLVIVTDILMFISMVVLSCLCAKYASDFNLNNQHEATPSLFESLTASAVLGFITSTVYLVDLIIYIAKNEAFKEKLNENELPSHLTSLLLPANTTDAIVSSVSITNEIAIKTPSEILTAAAQSRVNQTESSPLILNNQVNYNQNNANFISKTNKIKIFISNLPCHLKQTEYEDILTDKLKNNMQLKWAECEAVYSKYGAAVIWYNDRETASKAYELLKNSNHENNSLKCLYLPSIQQEIIPANVCPLLVFVNSKSGGNQGKDLLLRFNRLLNPRQVYDLKYSGPLPGLHAFRDLESYRILVCGGDGTVGWVLSYLENVSRELACKSPPIAIIPLGTGNDLSRVLGWGGGFSESNELIKILQNVFNAEQVSLDRWNVTYKPLENDDSTINNKLVKEVVMNNYFGIGIVADVCLAFHLAREKNPNKFNSRLRNKIVYFQLSLTKMIHPGVYSDLKNCVNLEVDGRQIDLPGWQAIEILNIPSWAGGSNPWGNHADIQFLPPTHSDGLLEIVGLNGIIHAGCIQPGLSSAVRIAQGQNIRLKVSAEIAVQVDGEPWLQSPCVINISKSAFKANMLKKI